MRLPILIALACCLLVRTAYAQEFKGFGQDAAALGTALTAAVALVPAIHNGYEDLAGAPISSGWRWYGYVAGAAVAFAGTLWMSMELGAPAAERNDALMYGGAIDLAVGAGTLAVTALAATRPERARLQVLPLYRAGRLGVGLSWRW